MTRNRTHEWTLGANPLAVPGARCVPGEPKTPLSTARGAAAASLLLERFPSSSLSTVSPVHRTRRCLGLSLSCMTAPAGASAVSTVLPLAAGRWRAPLIVGELCGAIVWASVAWRAGALQVRAQNSRELCERTRGHVARHGYWRAQTQKGGGAACGAGARTGGAAARRSLQAPPPPRLHPRQTPPRRSGSRELKRWARRPSRRYRRGATGRCGRSGRAPEPRGAPRRFAGRCRPRGRRLQPACARPGGRSC